MWITSNHICRALYPYTAELHTGVTYSAATPGLESPTTASAASTVRKELKEARAKLAAGLVKESYVEEIHARYTYRMHDLSEFMKGLMQRFCLRSTPATPSVRASSGAQFQDAA